MFAGVKGLFNRPLTIRSLLQLLTMSMSNFGDPFINSGNQDRVSDISIVLMAVLFSSMNYLRRTEILGNVL
jgi:hypothetical protein